MSTHSTISVKLPDGKIRSVYCHFDGMIQSNGRMLVEHYNSQELAEQLTSLGHLSYIAPLFEPTSESGHCFEDPEPLITVVYSRDRGEKDQIPNVWNSEEEFSNDFENKSFKQEYNYLFKDGEWYVCWDLQNSWSPVKNHLETNSFRN